MSQCFWCTCKLCGYKPASIYIFYIFLPYKPVIFWIRLLDLILEYYHVPVLCMISVSCPELPPLTHAAASDNYRGVGTKITITCAESYTTANNKQSYKIKCNQHGDWEPEPTDCTSRWQ